MANLNLATLTTNQGFSISDAPIGSGSGFSVAGIGDINNDGYDDIIIGAPSANNYAGISYVIYGGTTLSNIDLTSMTSSQGFSISGAPISSESGCSVRGVGDINNDGYDDIIIGAPFANNNAGISYVIYGGTLLSNINLTSMTSSQGFSISDAPIGSDSGLSVAGIGDINNDGYDDIIIGAPSANNYAGISYVIYGSTTLSNIDLAIMTSSQGFSVFGALSNSDSGFSVAGIGDINNDGYDDIIIGAPFANNYAGISYVIYGGTTLSNIDLAIMTSSQGFSVSGALSNSDSGYSVAGAGDINNDGYDDVIIGAPTANNNAGVSYVVYGSPALSNINLANMTSSQGFSISGVTASSESGSSVAGAGDINNDGYDDVIIGARYANNEAGISYVVYGGTALSNINLTNMTSSQGFSISGAAIGSESGSSVAGAGDINNDGYNDVIIGAPYTNNGVGISYVIYGAASGFITNSPTLSPVLAPTLPPTYRTIISLSSLSSYQGININGAVSSSSGYSVGAAGDINNDGYDDFMVGAPYISNYEGKGYIIYGNSELSSTINLIQVGSQGISMLGLSDSYTGNSLNSAGDVNGDGFNDFAICSSNVGMAYIIYSSTPLTSINLVNFVSVQGFSASGALSNSDSGYSVAGAGDINNDGISDIIIGAPYANNEAGVSYVVYGGTALSNINLANMTSSQGFSIFGAATGSESGFSVTGAGDINNDGYDDVIIGAPFANNNAGISYIVYGGVLLINISLANITSLQGFSISGAPTASKSGWSVAGAGDINNDGIDDVIIGAPYANTGAGISYVVYGGMVLSNINLASITSSQGFSISGAPTDSYSGHSVAGVGDINNDGIDDVIIGAYEVGISYIIYGSASLSNINLANMTSSQGFSIYGAVSSSSGYSVGAAGDINNDGIDDIIIGAPFANNYAGISYVVYGGTLLSNINLANMTSLQGFSISGAPTASKSGYSVAGAGDINNDGYDDVIIGVPFTNNSVGISYVVYGGALLVNISLTSITSLQGFSISGAPISSESGRSVKGVGDINNDGYDDIIIGAPFANNYAGISYVVYGGATLSNIDLANFPTQPQGFSVSGLEASASGCSIACAGDINKDGYDDIIIGNPNLNGNTGAAYVIYGNANFLSNIDLSILNPISGFAIIGTVIGGYLGNSVAGIGDINNDSYADLIIGAPYANNYAGIAYVLFGNTTINSPNLANLISSQGFIISGVINSQSGWSVSGAGDLNKDGYNDIIIGAPNSNNSAGEVYVIYGQTYFNNIDLSVLTVLQGFNIIGISNSYCGFSVNSAGDINNDSYPDLIIGAPYANNQAGEAYVIYGSVALSPINLANLGSNQGFYITSPQPYSQSGYSVAGAGDINNDGYDDVIIGAPNYVYDNSIAGAAFIVYGADSGFTTLFPTSSPTSSPTLSPVSAPSDDDIENSIEFKVGFSVATFALSAIGAWILREKIAFYVLNNWGHEYKLYNPYIPVKENEIEIKLSLKDNNLLAMVKLEEHILLDSDHDNHGVSKLLHNRIIQAIDNPEKFRSFTFYQFEKNQIRDYLIAHNYLAPARTYCLLNSYRELGYVKGILYNIFLNNFEVEHSRACKKQMRTESITAQVSMDQLSSNSVLDNSDSHSTSNPIISSSSMESSTKSAQWDIRRNDRTTIDNDEENPVRDSKAMEISGQNSKDLISNQSKPSSKTGCVIMCISAMGPDNFKLQGEAFSEVGGHMMLAAQDLSSLLNNVVAKAYDSAPKLLDDNGVQDTHIVATLEHMPKGSAEFSSSTNLMISLLGARQIIEYLPMFKYIAQGTINTLGYNITLPTVLDDQSFLISVHYVIGHEVAKLLPYESINQGLLVSTLTTGGFALKLATSAYFHQQKIEAISQDEYMGYFEMAKYCSVSILTYTVPNMVNCAVSKLYLPNAECLGNGYDLTISASIGGAECYSLYKAVTGTPSNPTTTDVVVPYIADSITLVIASQYVGFDISSAAMAMQTIKQGLVVASLTVATDYMSRIAIDIVPIEVKETYVDPMLNYVGETYELCTNGINEFIGTAYDYFNA